MSAVSLTYADRLLAALAAVKEHQLPPTEAHVLLVLTTTAITGDTCWPGLDSLARDVARGRSVVAGAVWCLERRGMIKRRRRAKGRTAVTTLLLTSGRSDITTRETSGQSDIKTSGGSDNKNVEERTEKLEQRESSAPQVAREGERPRDGGRGHGSLSTEERLKGLDWETARHLPDVEYSVWQALDRGEDEDYILDEAGAHREARGMSGRSGRGPRTASSEQGCGRRGSHGRGSSSLRSLAVTRRGCATTPGRTRRSTTSSACSSGG